MGIVFLKRKIALQENVLAGTWNPKVDIKNLLSESQNDGMIDVIYSGILALHTIWQIQTALDYFYRWEPHCLLRFLV